MMDVIWILALIMLALAILGCLYRVIRGPSMADRIIALDTIGIQLLAIVAIFGALMRSTAYFGTVLVIGILGFLGTTAFARYIERGVVIEHGDEHTRPDHR